MTVPAPYEDQEKLLYDSREAYKQGYRQIMCELPTGGGKTVVASNAIQRAKKRGNKTLFLCDRISLCEQAAKTFYQHGHRVGVIQQGYRGDTNPEVLVGSVQSMVNMRIPDVNLIIRDEGHVFRAYDKHLMETYNNVLFMGLSATPLARGLGKHYKKLIKGPSTQELIDGGRLTPSDMWAPSKPDLDKIKLVAGEYNQKELGKVTAKRIGEVTDQWFELGQNRQTMISATNCADSISIIDRLVKYGIKAVHVDYRTSIKEMYDHGGIIDQYKNREIQVLSSVFKLSIGIDLPLCSCLVFAAPTKSLIRHRQFWGRGIRSYEGKEDCVVIDMVGNIDELRYNTDSTPDFLDMGDKPANQSLEYEVKDKEPARCKARDSRGHICGAEKKGSRTCPKCGFTPTPRSGVESINGKLVKIDKNSNEYKENFYAELLGLAEKPWLVYPEKTEPYKPGWAKKRFQLKFDQWPNDNIQPKEPSKEVINYIKYSSKRRKSA